MHLNKFKLVKKLKLLRKIFWINKLLNYSALDPAIINNSPVIVRGHHVCNHDLYHLEISHLERIKIGKHMVSGIHGINSHIFHDAPINEEYESFLDEARVAFHEWLTRTSLINSFKAFLWTIWLIFNGINAFAVIYRHYKTLDHKNSNTFNRSLFWFLSSIFG